MFEPLPSYIRLHRERQNLSQERLAKMAKVSRGQLVAFEKGEQNVTIAFLLKIARALKLTELPIAEIRAHDAPIDITALLLTADAFATAQKVLAQAAAGVDELETASATVKDLIDRALTTPRGDASLTEAVARLAATAPGKHSEVTRGLRELAESPGSARRVTRPKSAAKPAARKRSR